MPLKVDTATPEYAALQRKHKSEGNTIPKIFVIRADGQKLYAKSGSLSGDQLPTLLAAAVREMGRPLTPTEVKALDEINKQIEESLTSKNLKAAASLFRKLKKLGDIGQIGSYAKSALTNNELAKRMAETVETLAKEYVAGLDSQTRFETALKAIQLKSDVGTLAPFRVPMNELEKKVRMAFENSKDYSEVKNVAAAIGKLNHKSESTRRRAAETVSTYAQNTKDSAARTFLAKLLDDVELNVAPKPETSIRTWTSNDGKFTVDAKFVEFDGVNVKLEKKNGEVISVPLKRLSEADQDLAKKQK